MLRNVKQISNLIGMWKFTDLTKRTQKEELGIAVFVHIGFVDESVFTLRKYDMEFLNPPEYKSPRNSIAFNFIFKLKEIDGWRRLRLNDEKADLLCREVLKRIG